VERDYVGKGEIFEIIKVSEFRLAFRSDGTKRYVSTRNTCLMSVNIHENKIEMNELFEVYQIPNRKYKKF
jgi:hypothetical protein